MAEQATIRRRWRAPWAIFWVGFALRVAVILIGHTYRVPLSQAHFKFGWEMGRIARSLVRGQGFANPFNGISGPTAWTPPLYPLLMALSFKLFGVYSNAAAVFLLVVNSVFSAGIAPAVYEIAARCFDARGLARRKSKYAEPVALWSAWLWAVYPAALQYAIHWIWEMSISAFLFSWVIVVALRLRGVGEDAVTSPPGLKPNLDEVQFSGLKATAPSERPKIALWVGFAVLWGLLNLSNASVLLCLPAMLVWIVWKQGAEERGERRKALRRGAVGALLACVVMCGVMLPWWVRNERALHACVATRANLGVEMYMSTLPASGAYEWGTSMSLWPGEPEFQRYVREGEVRYSNERKAEALARMRERPGRIAGWMGERFLFFWDGTPHSPENHPGQEYGRQLSYAFLSLCGLLGLALMLRRRVEGAGLFALVFVLLPIPYYVITVQPRFRHPMEPLIAVLAVYLFRSTGPRRARLMR